MTSSRTLVVHTGGIGDLLLVCPALQRLSDDHGPIDLLGIRERAELAVALGVAASAVDLSKADFESLFVEPSETFRRFIQPYADVVVWMSDSDGAIRSGLEACGIAAPRIFPGLPPTNWRRHASEYYLDCLGYGPADPLNCRVEAAETAHEVIIHPGSGSARKNWPLESFLEVADRVRAADYALGWCLGPAEVESQAFSSLPKRDILEAHPLTELARILVGVSLYIGNDSGITHLAAAVGCPVVTVHIGSDPIVWAPRGDDVRVVYEPRADAIEDVWEAASLVLDGGQIRSRHA